MSILAEAKGKFESSLVVNTPYNFQILTQKIDPDNKMQYLVMTIWQLKKSIKK